MVITTWGFDKFDDLSAFINMKALKELFCVFPNAFWIFDRTHELRANFKLRRTLAGAHDKINRRCRNKKIFSLISSDVHWQHLSVSSQQIRFRAYLPKALKWIAQHRVRKADPARCSRKWKVIQSRVCAHHDTPKCLPPPCQGNIILFRKQVALITTPLFDRYFFKGLRLITHVV